ncbi:MAG TPA: hypothetical protein VIL36_03375 [Acidimicrobiales bacterium]
MPTDDAPPPPGDEPPDDAHELLSFEDDKELRTWVFDVTFLASPWRCIYGDGCPGVLTGPAPELEQGCCSYGAHLVDAEDAAAVTAAAARLTADQWQHKAVAEAEGGPLHQPDADGPVVTRLADDACIFLNGPDFPGGAGCALHRGALEAGERPMDWKPDVCWQLPLRRVDHTEDGGHVVTTVREWKRRDWGAGGDDFHWWCTDAPDAFDGHRPVYEELRDELVELVGAWAYERLVEELHRRGTTTLLPHPTLRPPLRGAG